MRFRLRCRSSGCLKDWRVQGAYCPNCGFLSALLESNTADSSVEEATVICSRCNSALDSSDRPARCLDCLGESQGWWDVERNAWAQPDLRPSHHSGDSGVWVCGDFVGDLHSPAQLRVGLTGAGRHCAATFHRGTLSNPRRVSGPPLAIDDDESAPLRQALLQHVGVRYGRKEASISLHDLRLHRWSTESIHEVEANAPGEMIQVLARVRGRAYAFIERHPEDTRAPEVRDPAPETAPEPTPAPAPEAKDAAPEATRPDLPESETPPRPEDLERTVTACFICDWRAQLVMAVLIGLSCNWLAALLWVLGVGRVMCAIDHLRASAGKGFGLEKPWWMLGLVLMALAGYGLARLHLEPCSVLRIGSLALPLAAVLLGAWFKPCWFKSLLFVIWLATLQTGCGLGECRAEQSGHSQAPQSTQSGQSTQSQAAPTADAPPGFVARLGQGLSALKNRLSTLLSFDPTANALSQASEGDERGRRLSVNDAVADPSLLADCRNSVYFPGVAMFDLNSAEINPAVHSQLVRMDRVLKAFPDRQFLIVGHTDRTGQDTPDGVYFNVMLSEQRAAAVARWLADNTAWPLDRTEVRGAGGKFPILNVRGESALNRRVEIRLKCR